MLRSYCTIKIIKKSNNLTGYVCNQRRPLVSPGHLQYSSNLLFHHTTFARRSITLHYPHVLSLVAIVQIKVTNVPLVIPQA